MSPTASRQGGSEREVKLTADGRFDLPDLTGLDGMGPPAVLAEEKLEATYYDTADLRLARWGVTLRFRREGSAGAWWTVKLPAGGRDALPSEIRRSELPFAGGPRAVPAEALHLLRAYVRGTPVEPVARLVTRRRTTRLVTAAGDAAVAIDDDRVSVLAGREVVAWFREIEVESLGPDGDGLLRPVRNLLLARGARDTAAIPKAVRALGARAMDEPEVPLVAVSRSSPAGAVVRAAIASGVRRMIHHDPGVRLGEDPEAVHQARVGTRRLRSDLRTFRSLLDEEWVEETRGELAWVADALGAVRDADVLLDRLRASSLRLPAPDRKAAASLLGRLERERDEARGHLLVILDDDRYLGLLDRLVAAATSPPLVARADEDAVTALPDLVRAPWRHLAQAVADLPEEEDVEGLHQVRIRAKRCRYAAEAAQGVIGGPARRLAQAVAEVQGVLGDLNDATVAEAWLRQAASRSAALALVAGQLIAWERADGAEALARWPDAWEEASRKKLRGWLAR